jgi:transcriptional regulator with XRE-family HTH domain
MNQINQFMGIGTKLKKLRSKTKYSQQNIADLLGVDKNTYANWENELNDIKSEHIPKLAEIFDIEIQDLFHDRPSKIQINFNKQVNKDNSTNNSVVLVLPDKESVEKLVVLLEDRILKK